MFNLLSRLDIEFPHNYALMPFIVICWTCVFSADIRFNKSFCADRKFIALLANFCRIFYEKSQHLHATIISWRLKRQFSDANNVAVYLHYSKPQAFF
jgi:hypothetical protein